MVQPGTAWRLGLLLATFVATAVGMLLLASFVDLVQTWALYHGWAPSLVD